VLRGERILCFSFILDLKYDIEQTRIHELTKENTDYRTMAKVKNLIQKLYTKDLLKLE
jgi:hypothetical protein